ncbi:MAG: hypothetical protein K0U78_15050 [Actinomycetia bacterium]|nr:hypothetical protein [Actinomycetes bacterium]
MDNNEIREIKLLDPISAEHRFDNNSLSHIFELRIPVISDGQMSFLVSGFSIPQEQVSDSVTHFVMKDMFSKFSEALRVIQIDYLENQDM